MSIAAMYSIIQLLFAFSLMMPEPKFMRVRTFVTVQAITQSIISFIILVIVARHKETTTTVMIS